MRPIFILIIAYQCIRTLFPVMGIGSTFSNVFIVNYFVEDDYVIGNLVEILDLGI